MASIAEKTAHSVSFSSSGSIDSVSAVKLLVELTVPSVRDSAASALTSYNLPMLAAPSFASSTRESAAVPTVARGWLVAFVVAGLASVIVSSLVTAPAIRGVVTGASFVIQLVAFSKVWFPGAQRA